MRPTLAIPCGLALLAALAGSGCTSAARIGLTETGAPDFKQLAIVYDVNSVGGLAGIVEPSGVRTAGLAEPGHRNPPPTRLRLEVQYPYPGVNPEFVHATLQVLASGANGSAAGAQSGPPPGLRGFSNANSHGGGLLGASAGPPPQIRGPQAGEECLVIDMPKTELSALFVDLANDGFFQQAGVKAAQAHLEVIYNQGLVDKSWNREPQLDQLVALLRRHGTPTIARAPNTPIPGYYTARTGKDSSVIESGSGPANESAFHPGLAVTWHKTLVKVTI